MNRPVIVGLGEVLWDVSPQGKFLGGAPANFAFHASQLGAEGIVASAVGRDTNGEEILLRLESLGLPTTHIQRNAAPTGTVTIVLDDQGKATYTIHENTAWDVFRRREDWDILAQRADAVCFGSLCQRSPASNQVIRRFLQIASRTRCLRIFDVNLRQSFFTRETIHLSLQSSDIVKFNDEELPVVAAMLELPDSEEDAVAALWKRYPAVQVVALTRGDKGSTLFSCFRRSDHAAYPLAEGVKPNTVGAGDSFTAALAVGMLCLEDMEAIHERASQVASFVCSQPGATPKLPLGK